MSLKSLLVLTFTPCTFATAVAQEFANSDNRPAVLIQASRSVGALDERMAQETIDLKDWLGSSSARLEDVMSWSGLGSPGASTAPDLSNAVQMRGFVSGAETGTGLGTSRLFLGMHPDIGRRFVRDLFTVDSITVQQGPDATLTGMGNPAGAIQYNAKTAVPNTLRNVAIAHDSTGLWRASADLGLPIGEDTGLSTRLVASSQRQGHTQDRVRTDRDVLYWTSRYKDHRQIWDLAFESQNNRQPFGFGTVYAGGQFRYDQTYVDTQRAKADRHYQRFSLTHDNTLNEHLHLKAWWNQARTQRDETLVGFYTVISPSTLSGYWREVDESTTQQNLGLALSGSLASAAGPQHQWQLRWQHNQQNLRFWGPQSTTGFTLDVQHPDFASADPSRFKLTPRWWLDKMRDDTLSVQDRLRWTPHWQLTLALSRTHAQIDSANTRTETPPAMLSPASDTRWTAHSMSLEHQHNGQQQWLSYGMGYEPSRGQQRDGSYLPPVQSTQWELGWRQQAHTDPDAADLPPSWHASLWQSIQINVAGVDPVDKNYLVPIGTVQGHGLQLGIKQKLADWQWQAQWQRQHVRTSTPANAGTGPWLAGTPDQWASLRLTALRWPGQPWALVQAVARKPGDSQNSFHAAGYALLSLGAHTQLDERWTLSGQISNALDKRYIASLYAYDSVWQGPRRKGLVELMGRF